MPTDKDSSILTCKNCIPMVCRLTNEMESLLRQPIAIQEGLGNEIQRLKEENESLLRKLTKTAHLIQGVYDENESLKKQLETILKDVGLKDHYECQQEVRELKKRVTYLEEDKERQDKSFHKLWLAGNAMRDDYEDTIEALKKQLEEYKNV